MSVEICKVRVWFEGWCWWWWEHGLEIPLSQHTPRVALVSLCSWAGLKKRDVMDMSIREKGLVVRRENGSIGSLTHSFEHD